MMSTTHSMAWAGRAHAPVVLDAVSIARRFSDTAAGRIPMRVRDDSTTSKDLQVASDVPTDLVSVVKDGAKITIRTLQDNASVLLDWFEHTVIEHVLIKQADSTNSCSAIPPWKKRTLQLRNEGTREGALPRAHGLVVGPIW